MKNNNTILIGLLIVLFVAAGCSIIAGSADEGQDISSPFRLNFVESLRNQKSLRGESLREFTGANPSGPALQRPSSVYADQFRVYVTDSASPAGVFVFDRGDAAFTLLPTGSGDGKLMAPERHRR